jgi:integrase
MQKGQIFKRHGAWHVRYRLAGKQKSVKLADVSDEYRTLTHVRPLAESHLRPINQGFATDPQTVQQFIEAVYFPHVTSHKRPSTVKGYKNIYNGYLAQHVAGARIFGFRTRDGQALLNRVAAENDLSHQTFTHVKSFLSGVFSMAKRMGSIDGENPMHGTEIPKGRQSDETYAYSNAEIDAMLSVLEGAPRVVVTVAAYTGFSVGELQGLQWQDAADQTLSVQRTVWNDIEGPPKTRARKDAIPLLPIVATALDDHRKANPGTKWVFEGPLGRPLDVGRVGNLQVKPAIEKAGVQWHGWHALRRGFATRLHEAGVQDRTIQALMRHSSMSVTMRNYVKVQPKTSVDAMEKLIPRQAEKVPKGGQ